MKNDLLTLIEYGIQAPSGENAQPWRFRLREDGIDVFVEESRDTSPYSAGHRSAYVAVGAALENIRLGGESLGLHTSFALFPDPNNPLFVARVTVTRNPNKVEESLGKVIAERVTNRKPYKSHDLTQEELHSLTSLSLEEGIGFKLLTDRESVKTLALAGTTNERIMLGNKDLHAYFFSHVNWTKHEDDKKKEGFFIKTLELPAPAELGFKVMSAWSRAKFLNTYLKFNEMVQKQNAALYSTSSGVGVVFAENNTPRQAVLAGMSLERIWLTATALGLSVQPISGLFYLKLGVDQSHGSFSEDEKRIIADACGIIQKKFGIEAKQPFFMFRIGKAAPPSARAIRFKVDFVLEK